MATAPAAYQRVSKYIVYVGTYTAGASQGIYRLQLDFDTGKLSCQGVVRDVTSPSFLAIHPSKRFLYAVNEIDDFGGQSSGAISAFAIEKKTGDLTFLNQHPSGGAFPCYLAVDSSGQSLMVANYGGGSVASFPIKADGRLAPAATFIQHTGSSLLPRQAGPHAHSVRVTPDNRFVVVADLGIDQLLVYRLNPHQATLTPHTPPGIELAAGSGPRHVDFHPNCRWAYVINEIDLTFTVLSYDADQGLLQKIETVSTLPPGVSSIGSTAEIRVHPSGCFLYGSNRGHNTIVVFSIDERTGKLSYVQNQSVHGRIPRNFDLDPTGTFLLTANQLTNTVVVFRIDLETGALSATGHQVEVPTPVCLQMIPA